MNGIIYCRVSTKEQVEGTSLQSQRQACLEYAAQNHIHILGIFTDEGESAKFADRTQLIRLIDFCKDRKNSVQALVVWKLDRFARNVADHFNIKSLIAKFGVTIHSVTEPIDSRPEGRFMETMLAGAAQFENDIRAIRCVGGMQRRIEEGIYPFKPPLGYQSASSQKAKKTEADIPDPERFPVIKEGWRRLLSSAYTKADIVRFFIRCDLKTRKGRPVSDKLADKIFGNRYYAGIIVNPWTKQEVRGKHVPMVTEQEFYRVQRILAARGHHKAHIQIREDFPLRGLLFCPSCRRPLTSSWSQGRNKRYPYYHCYSKTCSQYGKGNHGEEIERQFLALLSSLVPKSYLITRIAGRISVLLDRQQEDSRKFNERVKNDLKKLEMENQKLIVMKRKELITDDEFIRNHNQLADQIGGLMATIHGFDSIEKLTKDEIQQTLSFLELLPGKLDCFPIRLRRRFQQTLFPEGLTIGRFGTAKKSPIFKLIGDFQDGNPTKVDLSSESWNRIQDQFLKLSELIQSLQKGEDDLESPVRTKAT